MKKWESSTHVSPNKNSMFGGRYLVDEPGAKMQYTQTILTNITNIPHIWMWLAIISRIS